MSSARVDVLREGPRRFRDLGSAELWERSLARSRQRRRLYELSRRTRRRRKSISLAVSAAMAGGPTFPQVVAAASGGPDSPASSGTDGSARTDGSHVVLELGSQGPLVTAAQRRLDEVLPLSHLAEDGIFGPLTRGAVRDFQRRHGLHTTGAIDVATWASLFNAPVLVFGGGAGSSASTPEGETHTPGASGSAGTSVRSNHRPAVHRLHHAGDAASASGSSDGRAASASHADSGAAAGGGGGGQSASGAGSQPAGGQSISVVTPTAPTTQFSTYVLSNGVALPLPRQYITGGYVDQGVDYAAPGGTPLYAMGDGVIIGEGISGFGPNAPILKITSGPLSGLEVYYGHAGSNFVTVGQHVKAGQQISQVGYGIVGISTGPHLEIGFYPPGPMGAGGRMLSLINSLLHSHGSARARAARTVNVAGDRTSLVAAVRTTSAPAPSGGVSVPVTVDSPAASSTSTAPVSTSTSVADAAPSAAPQDSSTTSEVSSPGVPAASYTPAVSEPASVAPAPSSTAATTSTVAPATSTASAGSSAGTAAAPVATDPAAATAAPSTSQPDASATPAPATQDSAPTDTSSVAASTPSSDSASNPTPPTASSTGTTPDANAGGSASGAASGSSASGQATAPADQTAAGSGTDATGAATSTDTTTQSTG